VDQRLILVTFKFLMLSRCFEDIYIARQEMQGDL
jgi:hypothetical protein